MPLIELHAAQRDELQTIENLMQFYLYDFSEWLPLKFADHGFYSNQIETAYWRNPATRPFLIKVDDEIAGFVTVDDNTHIDGAEHNIGYMFVGRRWRGRGVAKFVVSTLLSQIPGQWQIFHIDANQPARLFWANAMAQLEGVEYTLHQQSVDGYPSTFYRFQSLAR
ncbi:GNAT family N-acetyltransferase [Rhodococcus sp. IEGM1300]